MKTQPRRRGRALNRRGSMRRRKSRRTHFWFCCDWLNEGPACRFNLSELGLFVLAFAYSWENDGLPVDWPELFAKPEDYKTRRRNGSRLTAAFQEIARQVTACFQLCPDSRYRHAELEQQRKRTELP